MASDIRMTAESSEEQKDKDITDLKEAIEEKQLSKVQYLVEKRCVDLHSVRYEDYNDTPLHLAVVSGALDIVKYLVEERSCDVECMNNDENTPLHYAAEAGHLHIVKYLINERGCDPMWRGENKRTPLHMASLDDNLDVMKYMIENAKVDPLCQDANGDTALDLVAESGTVQSVKYLIEECHCEKENDSTPLLRAASGGHLDTVQYLISERGYDAMCVGEHGETPLHIACNEGKLPVVEYLINDTKAEVLCRDDHHDTPLHIAAERGYLAIVKLLVEDYLCDPDIRNSEGETPVDHAEKCGNQHIVSYLSSIKHNDQFKALVSQLKPFTKKTKQTGTVLGNGTYGKVIELKLAGKIVAGKIFKISSNVRIQTNKVYGEVITMLSLCHPNIVECKGVSLLVNEPLPVLLMERLMISVHAHVLKEDNANLPLTIKLSILQDTASGLDYLHSQTPALIHRDLTATNVLLDSELKAKISDFGNSRMMDLDPESTPATLTALPGTLDYMPPEAHGGKTYDPSLDIFSFGHLSLFIITQKQVQILPSTYEDSLGELKAQSEVKRRMNSVKLAQQQLTEDHSLLVKVKQCLHNKPAQRPRAGELKTLLCEMAKSVREDSSSLSKADSGSGSADTDSAPSTHHGETEIKPPEPKRQRLVLDEKPTLPKLLDLRVPANVSDKYEEFGIILLRDNDGKKMAVIENNCCGRAEKITLQILKTWMEGDGMSVTWESLIIALKKRACSTLASQIEKALKTH